MSGSVRRQTRSIIRHCSHALKTLLALSGHHHCSFYAGRVSCAAAGYWVILSSSGCCTPYFSSNSVATWPISSVQPAKDSGFSHPGHSGHGTASDECPCLSTVVAHHLALRLYSRPGVATAVLPHPPACSLLLAISYHHDFSPPPCTGIVRLYRGPAASDIYIGGDRPAGNLHRDLNAYRRVFRPHRDAPYPHFCSTGSPPCSTPIPARPRGQPPEHLTHSPAAAR